MLMVGRRTPKAFSSVGKKDTRTSASLNEELPIKMAREKVSKNMLFFHGKDSSFKVKHRATIRNRYNQAPYLTQDSNDTTSQLDITNEGSAFSQQLTTRHHQTDAHESIRKQDRNNINDPQKMHRLGMVGKNILLEGLNRFNGAPTSPSVQMWIKTLRCLVCMKDP